MSNKTQEYGAISKGLHWLTVALLIAQYALGWIMPGVVRGMQPGYLMRLHMSFGILVGVVILLRLVWRLYNGKPEFGSGISRRQQRAAEAVHWLLYLLMGLMIITGWAHASGRGFAIEFFAYVSIPFLFGNGSTLAHEIGQLHSTLAWALLAVIALHVGAAFVHLLLWGDRVMQRMLPRLLTRALSSTVDPRSPTRPDVKMW